MTTVIDPLVATRRVPLATYRLQFRDQFPFSAAAAQIDYLHRLGISDVYASPILRARPGSPHGYDICDHAAVSDELGGEQALRSFGSELRRRGMGLIIDVVPNHMAVGHVTNSWWQDVLENGPCSRYADYFDIDWQPFNPELANKVLLPVLGEHYGQALDGGKLRLEYAEGELRIAYYESKFPIAPQTYPLVLELALEPLASVLGDDHESVLEFRSILTALGHLPSETCLSGEQRLERFRESTVVKRRISTLVSTCRNTATAVDAAVQKMNGSEADPSSMDALDELIARQFYRLAFWRVAGDEINYRRFFDVNELAAIRSESPEVFEATHRLVMQLLVDGVAQGLRIDHPDGLQNPTRYFRQLHEAYVLKSLERDGGEALDAGRTLEISAALDAAASNGTPAPLYVVAEKILGDNETLPRNWSIDGTTGYDFLIALNGLFVEHQSEADIERTFSAFIGRSIDFDALVRECKQVIMRQAMTGEMFSLSHQLDRIAERNRRYRDFTTNTLREAIREFIANLAVYRTYTTPEGFVTDRDRQFVYEAIELAKSANPRIDADVFHFLRDTILLTNLDQFAPADRSRLLDWVLRFQQVTGPVTAKGIEDTAFYVYNRFISLNEVGGHPSHFGVSVERFHEQNAARARDWPQAMLSSATHDTKRGEDLRARLNVISEDPAGWSSAVNRWRELNRASVRLEKNVEIPSPSDQYLFYQTLAGSWPAGEMSAESLASYRARVADYMEKATKEAKQETSWMYSDPDYDAGVRKFVEQSLAQLSSPFLNEFRAYHTGIDFYGRFNSVAQVVLKLTCPGVPDMYQGTELWDFSMVDPDNRRPVDYAARSAILDDLEPLLRGDETDMPAAVGTLLRAGPDGRIKLFTVATLLRLRAANEKLFRAGDYTPLDLHGTFANAACGFIRAEGSQRVLVLTCIRPRTVGGAARQMPVGDSWGDTSVEIVSTAPTRWRNVLTGELVTVVGGRLRLSDVFATLPSAVLVTMDANAGMSAGGES